MNHRDIGNIRSCIARKTFADLVLESEPNANLWAYLNKVPREILCTGASLTFDDSLNRAEQLFYDTSNTVFTWCGWEYSLGEFDGTRQAFLERTFALILVWDTIHHWYDWYDHVIEHLLDPVGIQCWENLKDQPINAFRATWQWANNQITLEEVIETHHQVRTLLDQSDTYIQHLEWPYWLKQAGESSYIASCAQCINHNNHFLGSTVFKTASAHTNAFWHNQNIPYDNKQFRTHRDRIVYQYRDWFAYHLFEQIIIEDWMHR